MVEREKNYEDVIGRLRDDLIEEGPSISRRPLVRAERGQGRRSRTAPFSELFLVGPLSIYPIDAFDRRPLVLWTLPFMKLFLLMMGFAFWIENLTTRVVIAVVGIYLFDIAYTPGEGPRRSRIAPGHSR
ncbi:hypothetical protein DFH09DRAFT_1393484 [Mycena vulgaris]|nr:hypothetical protein DFH09DRAFT_1393484 [Mycena vulgaris]